MLPLNNENRVGIIVKFLSPAGPDMWPQGPAPPGTAARRPGRGAGPGSPGALRRQQPVYASQKFFSSLPGVGLFQVCFSL
eukprot:754794-Hanusia_phi.AAC.10